MNENNVDEELSTSITLRLTERDKDLFKKICGYFNMTPVVALTNFINSHTTFYKVNSNNSVYSTNASIDYGFLTNAALMRTDDLDFIISTLDKFYLDIIPGVEQDFKRMQYVQSFRAPLARMWKEFLNCNSDRKKFIELLPTFFEQQRENVKEEVEQNSEN